MEINELKKLIPEKSTNQADTLLAILDDMELGETIKCEGLLHFLVLNNVLSLEQAEQDYPEASATLNILDKLEKIKITDSAEDTENIRKMFFAITKDIRIIMFKIALIVTKLRHKDEFD